MSRYKVQGTRYKGRARRLWRRIPLYLVLCTFPLLLSCGFQLRGAADLPPQMERTYLTGIAADHGFARELSTLLAGAGVTLVDSRQAASAEFRVRRLSSGRRVLSVGGDARVSEYELYLVLDYEVRGRNGEWALEPVTLDITREYVHDPLQVLSQTEQERALREAMHRDLAQLVMFRLQAATQ
jgi:LPS-assembly lipoprotein